MWGIVFLQEGAKMGHLEVYRKKVGHGGQVQRNLYLKFTEGDLCGGEAGARIWEKEGI